MSAVAVVSASGSGTVRKITAGAATTAVSAGPSTQTKVKAIVDEPVVDGSVLARVIPIYGFLDDGSVGGTGPGGTGGPTVAPVVQTLVDGTKKDLTGTIDDAVAAAEAEATQAFAELHDLFTTQIAAVDAQIDASVAGARSDAAAAAAQLQTNITAGEAAAASATSELHGVIDGEIASARSDLNAAVGSARSDAASAASELHGLLDFEAATRADGDAVIQSSVTALDSRVGASEANITTEEATRADAVSALSLRIDSVTATLGTTNAAVTDESVARSTADEAIAGRVTTVEANTATNAAAITSESLTRATNDGALASQITTVQAVAGRVHVFFQATEPDHAGLAVGDEWINTGNNDLRLRWNGTGWDDTSDGRFAINAAAITSESLTRVGADGALSDRIDAVVATTNGNIAAITNEETARTTADSAAAATTATLTVRVGATESDISTEQTVRSTADEALSGRVDSVNASLGTTNANVTSEIATRATADEALSGRIDTVTATAAGNSANLTSETLARTDADSALGVRIDTTNANVAGNASAITGESIVRSDQVGALSVQINTLTSTSNNNAAAISSEASTRTTADDALSGRIDTVSAQTGANTAGLSSEQLARTNGDSALGARIDTTNAAVSANAASITSETYARTNADTALGARIDTTNANVAGNTAAITQEAAARADAVSAESTIRQNQIVSLGAASSRPSWRQGTQPAWLDVFPAGVNALLTADTMAFVLGAGVVGAPGVVAATSLDYGSFIPAGGHTAGAAVQNNAVLPTGAIMDLYLQYVPVIPGLTYEFSAYLACYRGNAYLVLAYFDANGNEIAEANSTGGSGYAYSGQNSGIGTLDNYKRLWVTAGMPANAAYALAIVRVAGDNEAAPYVFVTRPKFGSLASDQSAPSAWTPPASPIWYDTADNNRPYVLAPGGAPNPGMQWIASDDLRIAVTQAAITNEQTERVTSDTSLAASITSVGTQLGATNANITSEIGSRSTADEALSGRIDTATAAIGANTSSISNETVARVNGDDSLTAQLQTLQSQVNGNTAGITSEEITRAAADSTLTVSIGTMTSRFSTPGGCFADPLFATSTSGVPNGWTVEQAGSCFNVQTAGAREGTNCLQVHVPNGTPAWLHKVPDSTWIGPWGNSATSARYYVLECDWEYVGGVIDGAGFLVTNRDTNAGWLGSNFTVALQTQLNGTAPQTGVVNQIAKVIDCGAPVNGGDTICYIFGSWGGFSSTAYTSGDKLFLIHRLQIRPATQQEIDTFTAGGPIAAAISSSITNEAATRSTADTAEATARQSIDASLQGQINSANGAISNNSAAITNEQNARVAADSAEASSRTTLESRVLVNAASGGAKIWTTATQPAPSDMFPVGANWLYNSGFAANDTLVQMGGYSNGTGHANIGTDPPDAGGSWAPVGFKSRFVHMTGATSDFIDLCWFFGNLITAGQYYELSAYTGAHRCQVYLTIVWYDSSGNLAGSPIYSSIGGEGAEWSDGSPESNGGGQNYADMIGGAGTSANPFSAYKRIWTHGAAPAGAVSCLVSCRMQGVPGFGADPYMFVTCPHFGRTAANPTQPSDYKPYVPQLWLNAGDNNKTMVWNGTGFVYSADQRIDANYAQLQTIQSTVNGQSVQWSLTGNINGVTGGFSFSGAKQLNGTVVYNVEFNSNVTINGTLLVNGTVNTGQLAGNAVTNSAGQTAAGVASVSLPVRAGSRITVMGAYQGVSDGAGGDGMLALSINGNAAGTNVTISRVYASSAGTYRLVAVPYLYTFTVGSDQTLTVTLTATDASGAVVGPVSLIVEENAR